MGSQPEKCSDGTPIIDGLDGRPVMPPTERSNLVLPNGEVERNFQSNNGELDERQRLIERWSRLRRDVVEYKGGTYPDGTPYSKGRRLIMGGEQIMDIFEEPWCRETVNAMFAGKYGRLNVVERGYGMGIMSSFILRQMLSRGGDYHIIELNRQVCADALKWARQRQRLIDGFRLSPTLKISVHPGDADKVLQEFPEQYFDLIFSDTHQLKPDERGINDLLALEELKKHLKPNGRFTFCAFHRDNQTGDLDLKQSNLVTAHFGYVRRFSVETVPPPDCTYLRGPRRRLPVVICEEPLAA